MFRERRTAWGPRVAAVVFGVAAVLLAAGAAATEPPAACTEEGRVLKLGFFHDFAPVSYSADRDPASAGFHEHRGYEADLLTALEAMGAARFSRRAAGGAFAGIWLKAATPEYDLIGGGSVARMNSIVSGHPTSPLHRAVLRGGVSPLGRPPLAVVGRSATLWAVRAVVHAARFAVRSGMLLDNRLLDETEQPWTWMSNATSAPWSARCRPWSATDRPRARSNSRKLSACRSTTRAYGSVARRSNDAAEQPLRGRMVDLKRSEISLIERFVAWPRGLGYVLDYSDRTFEEFFEDEFRIEIYVPAYQERGTSKRHHLIGFCLKEPSSIVTPRTTLAC